MPRIYKPKKDVIAVISVKEKDKEALRDLARIGVFILTSKLFPQKFNRLKERALPLQDDALEGEVASWVRSLNLVRYPKRLPRWALPKCDLWLRTLAYEQVQAWRGEPGMGLHIYGVDPETGPRRSNETPEHWRKRYVKARVAADRRTPIRWNRQVLYLDHLEWYVRYRVGKCTSYKELAKSVGRDVTTVECAIRAVGALIDPRDKHQSDSICSLKSRT